MSSRGTAAAVVAVLTLIGAWAGTCSTDETIVTPPAPPGEPTRQAKPRQRAPRTAAEAPRAEPPVVERPHPAKQPAPEPEPERKDLDPTVAVRLRVIGADGLTAAAAHVSVYQDPNAPPEGAETDAKGEATVRVLAGQVVALHAWKDDQGVVWTLRASRADATAPIDVYLRRAEQFTGRVVDERGQPVSTAVLRLALPLDFSGRMLRLRHPNGVRGPECRAVVTCSAQADGAFVFPPLPHEADTRLLADAAGFDAFEADLAALPRDEVRLRVEMRSEVLLRGRVTGRRGAAVRDFRTRVGARLLPAVVDEKGEFTVTGVSHDRGWLVLLPGAATGLAPREVAVPPTRGAEVNLGEIRLAEPERIAGTVVWPDGRVAEGGRVEVVSRVLTEGRTEVEIDANGAFRLDGAGDAEYRVRVTSSERVLEPAPVPGLTRIRASHSGASWRRGEVVRITLDAAPIVVLRSVDAKGADVPFTLPVEVQGNWNQRDKPPVPVVDGARVAIALTGSPWWRLWISDATHAGASVDVLGGWPVVWQTVSMGAKRVR